MDDGNTEHTFRCNRDDGQVMLGRVYILYDEQTQIYEEKSGKYMQKLVTKTEKNAQMHTYEEKSGKYVVRGSKYYISKKYICMLKASLRAKHK